MSRIVPAARQLIAEIDALDLKDVKAEPTDELDGFGFHRVVAVNAAGVKAMSMDVLEALGADVRVASVDRKGKGATVTFVPDSRADFTQDFGLALVVRAD